MTADLQPIATAASEPNIRVPAEWEPQEAIWIQWPGHYEKVFEQSFVDMTKIIVNYQRMHILCASPKVLDEARHSLARDNVNPDHPNIEWHLIDNDSAWMRDNGPVYVIVDGQMRIQNWKFNAWGGAFGADIPYSKDNDVPQAVGDYLDLPVDHIDIVHERGNLEFNGVDTLIANWSVIGDPQRNPGITKAAAEDAFKRHFGVSKVILIEGIPETDLTKGHVDGIARFINATTAVVAQCTTQSRCKLGDGRDDLVYENAARTIAEAGINVIRDPIEGTARYGDAVFDTNYTNWIVGNGFVLVVGFNNPTTDATAKSRVASYFPGRDVHVVEMLHSWAKGGGAHCHTNDQPSWLLN